LALNFWADNIIADTPVFIAGTAGVLVFINLIFRAYPQITNDKRREVWYKTKREEL
jgi:hypothetical protein